MLPSLSLAAKLPGQLGDLATLCPAVCELWQPVQVRDSKVVGKGGKKREGEVAGPVAPGKKDAEFPWSQPYESRSKEQASRGSTTQ